MESTAPNSEISLAKALNDLLKRSGTTVAVAEGSTGGRIGELLARYPGATAYFKGSVVTYDYASRTTLLGVQQALLERQGSVSEAAVTAMAEAVRQRFAADIGLASSGVAGPVGKNVGELWLALCTSDGTQSQHHAVAQRPRIALQREFTRLALKMLYDRVASG